MLKISKLFFIIIRIQFLILLQSCCLLVVPLEYCYKAGEGEKDVSADFERGHVVGKEYELLEDVFLSQMQGDEKVSLSKSLTSSYTFDKDGSRIELEIYLFSEVIPKGTRFRVCGVHVLTTFGNELCAQYILATLLDEHGNPLSTNDFYGNPAPVCVTYLFKNTSEMPNQNWIFTPMPRFIKEITKSES